MYVHIIDNIPHGYETNHMSTYVTIDGSCYVSHQKIMLLYLWLCQVQTIVRFYVVAR